MTTIYKRYQNDRQRELILLFARLDEWFDKHEHLLCFTHAAGGLNAREVLTEIVTLNRHLLVAAGVATRDAIKTNSHSVSMVTEHETCVPGGAMTCCRDMEADQREPENDDQEAWRSLRYQLRQQLNMCLQFLEDSFVRREAEETADNGPLDFLIHHGQRQLLHLETLQEAFDHQTVSLRMRTLRTLYRPVGERELERIIDSGMRAFPARQQWQPIFYPVLSFAHAAEIAERWNMGDSDSDEAGFVMAFEIPEEYFNSYEIQTAREHDELCVPARQLDDFNAHIADGIRMVKAFAGSRFEPSERILRLMHDQHVLHYTVDGRLV